jgi:hypothetical protein
MKYTSLALCIVLNSLPCSLICMEKKFEMKAEPTSVNEQTTLNQENPSQPQTLKEAQQPQQADPNCCELCLGALITPGCLCAFITTYGCCLPCLKQQTSQNQTQPQPK